MNRLAFNMMVTKIASAAIDIALRAAVLEKVAGLMPGTWSRNVPRFLKEAPATFPNADERWWDRRSMAMYNALLKHPRSILRDRAEDILGDFFAKDFIKGLAIAFQKLHIMETGEAGWRKAMGLMVNRGKQWALDIVRTKQYKSDLNSMEVGPSDEDTVRHEPSTEWDVQYDMSDEMKRLMLLMDRNQSLHAMVMKFVQENVQASHWKIWLFHEKNPDMTPQEVGVAMGFKEKYAFSSVYKAIKAVNQALIDAMQLPAVQDAIEVSMGRTARKRV